jgi:hypothetical protein
LRITHFGWCALILAGVTLAQRADPLRDPRQRPAERRPRRLLGLHADVHPVETTLHGEVLDRVELHTLLDKLETLGLEVVELRRSRAT